jgi:2-polyprenyl-3-methyl-5-hydroxy-6-metoxy-1,4-benzoquinol methylase
MIIHKLIAHHLKKRDDPEFYFFQAQDAIAWIGRSGVPLGPQTKALDLGCGHGVFGAELRKRGCQVTFADEEKALLPQNADAPFLKINFDTDNIASLGQYDLVICSNVLEHLAKPEAFLASAHQILTPKGVLYLSWTNWLSPWGGHEFSPFHYFGPSQGHKLYDKFAKRKRLHTPYQNLFPTYIGSILKTIRKSANLRISRAAPRYYTEFGFLLRIPVLREFVTWNCALLIERKEK